MLTPSDLQSTVGQGMTAEAAARMLRCSARTVYRAAAAYEIPVKPRHARIRGEAEWRAAFEEHGSARGIATALGLRDHKYVLRQLERYGLKATPDAWARQQEERAA